MKWNILLVFALFGLIACGGEQGKSGQSKADKEIEKISVSKERLEKDSTLIKELQEKAKEMANYQPAPFENVYWKLASMEMEGNTIPVRNTTIDASFVKGKVSGTTGCNNYFASFKADSTSTDIQLMGVVTTKKACQGNAMGHERRFTTLMKAATTYNYKENELVLSSEKGNLNFTLAGKN